VAGSANNQLKVDKDADRLKVRGILYAPDYVINAGGLIAVALELTGYSDMKARKSKGNYSTIIVFDI
jgi:glutamate dehydrogenase/leucine dehydrogenase